SFVKLRLVGDGFVVTDSFTPSNQLALERCDTDLGSAGPMLLPNSNLLIGGGKEGFLYVLRRDKLGGHKPAGFGVAQCEDPTDPPLPPYTPVALDPQIVQSFQAVHPGSDKSLHQKLPSGWKVCPTDPPINYN